MKFKSLLVAILLSLMSCSTVSYMDFDVLKPAEFFVPPQIASVVIVNNSAVYRDSSVYSARVQGKDMKLSGEFLDAFPDSVIQSLARQLQNRLFFDTVYVAEEKYFEDGKDHIYQALTSQEIKEIRQKYKADGIISLDGYRYSSFVDVDFYDDGLYHSHMEVGGQIMWRFLSTENETEILRKRQMDTLYWHGEGYSIESSVENFPAVIDAVTEVAFYLGDSFANVISPHWEWVRRKFYLSGNQHFSAAADWLRKGNVKEAEKLWGFIYHNGSTANKARAAYNIAVSLEKNGLVNEAYEWAVKSLNEFLLASKYSVITSYSIHYTKLYDMQRGLY